MSALLRFRHVPVYPGRHFSFKRYLAAVRMPYEAAAPCAGCATAMPPACQFKCGAVHAGRNVMSR